MKERPMPIEDNKALVRRFFEETWNKGNPDAVDHYIAADCVSKSGVASGPLLKRAITNWHTAFPDFAFHIVRLVAEGDHVVAWTRFTGTHRGVFHHAPAGNRTWNWGPWEPTGKAIDVPEVYMFRVAAGEDRRNCCVCVGRPGIHRAARGHAGSGRDQDMN
jgi:predicted ester cyclase